MKSISDELKLYLLSQSVNNGYDTHDSCVVCAENEEEAKHTSPSEFDVWHNDAWYFRYDNGVIKEGHFGGDTWTHPDKVRVQFLGNADKSIEKGVVCASFNAG